MASRPNARAGSSSGSTKSLLLGPFLSGLLFTAPPTPRRRTIAQFAVTGDSDIQGNSIDTSALHFLVLLMELSSKWDSHHNDKLADAPTNMFFEEFDMKKRIHITTVILMAHFTTSAVYAKSGPRGSHKQRRDPLSYL